MKLKTVTTIALIGSIYWLIMDLMIKAGMYQGAENIVKVGWYNEYGQSQGFSVNSTSVILSIPYYICFFLFVTAFLRKIKSYAGKWTGGIAFALWCIYLAFLTIKLFPFFYLTFHFNGDMYQPLSYWEEYRKNDYFLLSLLSTWSWILVIINMILGLIAHFAFILVFVSFLKKDKVIGILGIVTMATSILYYLPIPYLSSIYIWSWIMLFAATLWRIHHKSKFLTDKS